MSKEGIAVVIYGPEGSGKSTVRGILKNEGFMQIRGAASLKPEEQGFHTRRAQEMLKKANLVGQTDFFSLLRVPIDRRNKIFDILDEVMTEQYREALKLLRSGHNIALDRGIISSQVTHRVLQSLTPNQLRALHLPTDIPQWAGSRFQRLENMKHTGDYKSVAQRTAHYVVCTAAPTILYQRAGGTEELRRTEDDSFMSLMGLSPRVGIQSFDGKPVLVIDTGVTPIGDERSMIHDFLAPSR